MSASFVVLRENRWDRAVLAGDSQAVTVETSTCQSFSGDLPTWAGTWPHVSPRY